MAVVSYETRRGLGEAGGDSSKQSRMLHVRLEHGEVAPEQAKCDVSQSKVWRITFLIAPTQLSGPKGEGDGRIRQAADKAVGRASGEPWSLFAHNLAEPRHWVSSSTTWKVAPFGLLTGASGAGPAVEMLRCRWRSCHLQAACRDGTSTYAMSSSPPVFPGAIYWAFTAGPPLHFASSTPRHSSSRRARYSRKRSSHPHPAAERMQDNGPRPARLDM
jgi:hypothetical protein